MTNHFHAGGGAARAAVWEGRSDSEQQTVAVGRAVAGLVRSGDVITLIGELGAGKTRLVRGLARGMGIDEAVVSSPTFVLVQQYSPPGNGPALVHVDAYRLDGDDLDDVLSIGWGTDLYECEVVVVEWADRLAGRLPEDRLEVRLTHTEGHSSRHVSVEAHGAWRSRMAALGGALAQAVRAAAQETPTMSTDEEHNQGDQGSRSCPICKTRALPNQPAFPFCSDRCKTIDLAKWATGDFAISRSIEDSDLEEV